MLWNLNSILKGILESKDSDEIFEKKYCWELDESILNGLLESYLLLERQEQV